MRFARSDPGRKLQARLTWQSMSPAIGATQRAAARAAGRCLPWVRETTDLVVALGLSCVIVVSGFLTRREEP